MLLQTVAPYCATKRWRKRGNTMRTMNRLTHNKIKNAKSADGKTTLLCDGGGLWLQVSIGKAGQVNKSWLFRYAVAGTKISKTGREYRRERIMGLGPLHTVSLVDAPRGIDGL
jgi:hypothetical protein